MPVTNVASSNVASPAAVAANLDRVRALADELAGAGDGDGAQLGVEDAEFLAGVLREFADRAEAA
jgi:hypothetical protein